MKCKYCDAEMADWGGFCPVCGKNNAVEPETADEQVLPSDTEEGIDLPKEENVVEAAAEEEASDSNLKKMKRNMAMMGCVAVLAVLATVLFFGIRGGWDVSGWFDWLKPRENTIAYKDSYAVKDKKFAKKRDDVVATMGDEVLTNAQLQIYYWSEVYSFLSSNSSYLSYMNFDYTAPLDEQTCYFDAKLTWQQYFLQCALETWQSNAAFAMLARENNFAIPEEYREDLNNLETDLAEKAKEGGYESADAMVAESFGVGCTVADYKAYMDTYYLGYLYFAEQYDAIDPSMEEITAYFDANKETLGTQGVKQDGSYTVDVRHILVMIKTVAAEMEKDETANEESTEEETEKIDGYTQAQWDACRKAAQDILDLYLAGEMTEEAFGELANEHSEDNNGKVTNGGLYTYVYEGEMMEDFNSWCFEKDRQVGDTGLVRTTYGYHVMYFVGSEETWITGTRSALIAEKSNEIVADALDRFTTQINYKKIVLTNVTL